MNNNKYRFLGMFLGIGLFVLAFVSAMITDTLNTPVTENSLAFLEMVLLWIGVTVALICILDVLEYKRNDVK